MSNTLEGLANSIATITADFRRADGIQMAPDRVLTWVRQFSESERFPILSEMNHLLPNTYFSQARIDDFLEGVALNPNLCGGSPSIFWPQVELLNIQQHGSSQAEMVERLKTVLQTRIGVMPANIGAVGTNQFVYIDDFLFTGGHVIQDLQNWIQHTAPAECTVDVIVLALHRYGHFRAFVATNSEPVKSNLCHFARSLGKQITVRCWRALEIEDRLRYIDQSDVLRPKHAPVDPQALVYVRELEEAQARFNTERNTNYKLPWRTGDSIGRLELFSSGKARTLLEDQFLIQGCRIRSECQLLPDSERPLGHQGLVSLGFGGLVLSYRNCPNNCPLAWWAGNPWYPLFPRRTNRETSIWMDFDPI